MKTLTRSVLDQRKSQKGAGHSGYGGGARMTGSIKTAATRKPSGEPLNNGHAFNQQHQLNMLNQKGSNYRKASQDITKRPPSQPSKVTGKSVNGSKSRGTFHHPSK